MLKIAWVTLYLMSTSGGTPVEVAQFRRTAGQEMAQCAASMREAKSSLGRVDAVLVCVPVYKWVEQEAP